MADGDFIPATNIDWRGDVGVVNYGSDRNMLCFFFTKSVNNQAKSAQAGRPVHEDVVYVRIHPPGERLNIVERPATTQDQRRFPMQWAQFKENREQVPDGTPIDLLYPDHPSIPAMLRGSNVYTVEQLANLSADAIDRIGMGCQTHVNNATKYLAMASKGVGASQLRKELEERDRTISTQQHQIDLLKEQIDELMKRSSQTVDLATIQQLVAGNQQRPTYPAQQHVAPVFDASTAQINATSPTAEISRQRKSTKRSRARI